MLKRPLALAVISFLCGITDVIFDISILFTGITALVICLAAVAVCKRNAWISLFIIVIFLICGMLRMDAADEYRRKIGSLYDSRVETMTLTVTDFSDEDNSVAEFKDNGKTIKVYLKVENPKELFPGDIIRGEITLRKPFSSKISISDFSTYLCSRNIYLYAYAKDVSVIGCEKSGVKGFIYLVRRYVDGVGFANLDGNRRAFFNAMVLGDKHLISDAVMDTLQGAGLNHIAVVSGMHLSIMIALQMFLLNKIFGKRRIGSILAIAGAIFITLATGAGASVIRACIMCSIYQTARMCYRENDAISSLCAAAGIMCAFNPYILFNAGFVLSVLSVLGIVLYSEKITSFLNRFISGKTGEAASLCIAAQLTVTPAVMHYFNIFTPYALISNVLVFPFSTAVVVAGMAFVVFAKVPVLSDVTLFLVKLLSDVIEYVCSTVSAIPGAVLNTGGLDAVFLIMWGFILALIYVYPKKKELMTRAAAVVLGLLIGCSCVYGAKRNEIHLSFLTYGANSTTALHFPEKTLMMIDCADKWDGASLAAYYGKNFFDYAIITGKNEEEVLALAKEGYVKNLILPEELYSPEEKSKIIKLSKEYNLRTDFLKNGEYIFADGAFVEYLPIKQISNERRCVKIEYKEKSFVTLQALENKDIEKLCSLNVKIPADYLKLPFVILGEKTDVTTLTDGQIIQTEREFNIK